MTGDATAKTTIYYAPYIGNLVPIYNGTISTPYTFSQLTIGLGGGVPHIASGNVYDVFITINSGSPVGCTGPAWSSTTSRGTGPGTTQIHNSVAGYWTNQTVLAHCWGGAVGTTDYGSIAADQATYVGSVYATANGQTAFMFNNAGAAGGSNNFMAVYNAYNRVHFVSRSLDTNTSWTYSGGWRAADGSNSNRITFLDGLQQSPIQANYGVLVQTSTTSLWALGNV